MLIPRHCLEMVGPFNENPACLAEDYELWLRLAARFHFQYVPGEVAAIRRHPAGISRNEMALRQRVLGVLDEMDALYPQLIRRRYAAKWHEGYALSHGAVAMAAARKGQWRMALGHSAQAFCHLARLPGLGIPALRAWRRRSRVRGDRAR